MITKFKNAKGFVIYKITTSDYIILKAYHYLGGICDSCNNSIVSGYYIPVMHYFMCESCYQDWSIKATYYDEDMNYEKSNIKAFEKVLKRLNLSFKKKQDDDEE